MAKIIQVFILILTQHIFLTFLVEAREPSSSIPSNNDVQLAMKLLEKPDTNKIAEALSIFEKVLLVDPNQEEAHMGIVYARILEFLVLQEKDPKGLQDGLKHVGSVLKRNPRNEDAYYKKSQILFFLGKYEDGLKNLEESLKELPESKTIQKAIVTYLINLDRTDEAVKHLENYTQSFPEDLKSLEDLAVLYENMGEDIKARIAWMKIRAKSNDQEKKRLATEHIESLKKSESGHGAKGF